MNGALIVALSLVAALSVERLFGFMLMTDAEKGWMLAVVVQVLSVGIWAGVTNTKLTALQERVDKLEANIISILRGEQ